MREDRARRGTRPSEFGETFRRTRHQHQRRREAINAVRFRSAGKSRQQIREMLVEEFHARALTAPPDEVVIALADSIARPDGPITAAHIAASAARLVGGAAAEIRDIFKGVERVKDPSGADPFFVPPGGNGQAAEVNLVTGADRVLDERAKRYKQRAGGADLIPVRLESASTTQHDPVLTVHVDDHRVGTLSREDSPTFEHSLEIAKQQNQTLMTLGTYVRDPVDNSPHLRVYPAELPPR
jgi:hypothetical protein